MASARTLATACAFLLLLPCGAAAEYRLNAGDVLEIAVAGVPEMRHRAPVNLDGAISLPLIGQLDVLGLPLSQVRAKIQALLPTKVLNQRTSEGRENPVVISPDEITVSIAEYRPVYVNGDVAKPGELTYRPGMTLRQALALAGGYDIMRFRMDNPFLESADLRSEYHALWTEYARGRARIARIRSELGEAAGERGHDGDELPIPRDVAARIKSLEAEQLTTRTADYEKEKVYLKAAIKQSNQKVAVLTEQQKKEQEGTDADAADLERVRDLFQKGTIPITRVTEARRFILLSSTRLLQTMAQTAQFEKERDELGRKLERLDDQRRLELLRELQDAVVVLSNTRSRLQSVGEKLVYTGIVKSQLVRGTGANPELVLFRKDNGAIARSIVDEDIELMPGDVVEVALHQPPDLAVN